LADRGRWPANPGRGGRGVAESPCLRVDAGARFDQAVASALRRAGRTVSLREVRRGIREGSIRSVIGRTPRSGGWLSTSVEVDVSRFTERAAAVLRPHPGLAGRISVVGRGEGWLALDKPSRLPTLPLRPDETETLLHAAIAIEPDVANAGPPLEGGAVHRLDHDTSGAVVFARDRDTRQRLRAAFRGHRIEKTYLARVAGPRPTTSQLQMEGEIETTGGPRVRFLGPPGPISRVMVRSWSGEEGVVEVRTRYGRRHQVRVHLAQLGLPILGDALYGGPSSSRLWLHASRVVGAGLDVRCPASFEHPGDGS
jgi:23S rRNA pseudouridine1911/1915/1917 synthase